MGSPPLARERLKSGRCILAGVGITPARAGKTTPTVWGQNSDGDHPRSRGKDDAITKMTGARIGSPPLARERLRRSLSFLLLCGITPARAGKTRPHLPGRDHEEDHPRSRGKDICMMVDVMGIRGSPPLARERPDADCIMRGHPGITPARAGKTERPLFGHRPDGDHPRSRGKDKLLNRFNAHLQGSPPLARERLGGEIAVRPRTRITPARAGKTDTGWRIRSGQ